MALTDAVLRKVEGVISNPESVVSESHSPGARRRHRVPAVHATGRVPRLDGARRAAQRRPRRRRPLARGAGRQGGPTSPASARRRRTRRGAVLRRLRPHARVSAVRPRKEVLLSIIENIERQQLREDIPQFKAGDTVKVHFKVIEGTRHRIQVFQGIVIKRQGSGVRETFTVRKQSFGVGVERTFPVHSPEDREDRGHGDRRRAPRQAVLPAPEGRQAGARPREAALTPHRPDLGTTSGPDESGAPAEAPFVRPATRARHGAAASSTTPSSPSSRSASRSSSRRSSSSRTASPRRRWSTPSRSATACWSIASSTTSREPRARRHRRLPLAR